MAENDWDEDNFEVDVKFKAPVVATKWDGEDEDVEVKDNWEDFDEEEKDKESETKVDAQPVKVKKKKLLEKAIAEKESKKKKDPEENILDEPQVLLTSEELLEDKLRRQRLQEESDLQLAKEAFGVDSGSNDVKFRLESMCPSTRDDFDTYRKALIETISKHEKSPFYVPFLDDFFRELCIDLEADEVKKLGNTLHVLANEKVKATRAASKGKKKGKAKASLVLGKPDDYDLGGEYEPNEFDDFM